MKTIAAVILGLAIFHGFGLQQKTQETVNSLFNDKTYGASFNIFNKVSVFHEYNSWDECIEVAGGDKYWKYMCIAEDESKAVEYSKVHANDDYTIIDITDKL